MGCASSTPMVQTAGSEILKAATHVAEDATKTAEEAVQGKAKATAIKLHLVYCYQVCIVRMCVAVCTYGTCVISTVGHWIKTLSSVHY